MQSNMIIF